MTENDTTSPRTSRGGCRYVTYPARVLATLRIASNPTDRNYGLSFRTTLTGRTPR